MTKFFIYLSIACMLGACSSVNVDPRKRDVDCAKFKSNGSSENRSLNIVTTEAKSLSVVAIGYTLEPARQPQNMGFWYGKECFINLLRDVSTIERIDDDKQKVTLRNGEVIEIGTYESKGTLGIPYNPSIWKILIPTPNGVGYFSEPINPFRNMAKLTVLNQPVSDVHLQSLAAFNLKEEAARQEEQKQFFHELEQKKLKREEEQRRSELARLAQEEETARQEEQKREWSRMMISKQENIGRTVCKDGVLNYSYNTGYVIYGNVMYEQHTEPGQLQGFLEGFSQDGNRIQFRVYRTANPSGRLKFNPSEPPMIAGFRAEPGAIYWDDVKDWFLCN
jgi:hypothetical protein